MGAELERRQRVTPGSLTLLFNECCPFYMSIGMSYKEFWEGDVCLPRIYMQAYEIQQKRRLQEMNYSAWLSGVYIMRAYEVVMHNAFAEQGTEPVQYYSKPIELTREQAAESNDEDIEFERLRVQVALDNFIKSFKKEGDHG